jgi:hypothetical protein
MGTTPGTHRAATLDTSGCGVCKFLVSKEIAILCTILDSERFPRINGQLPRIDCQAERWT